MTVLAAVCTKMPEAKLAIIFLPMFTFTAGNVSAFELQRTPTLKTFFHTSLVSEHVSSSFVFLSCYIYFERQYRSWKSWRLILNCCSLAQSLHKCAVNLELS